MSQVSVIIPTYNRAKNLPDAIESAINQTIPPLEVIVVDDASTDNTKEVCSEYENEITYIRHESNKGGAAARNTGINVSSGDYIGFLDSDDQWKSQKLDTQLNILKTKSEDYVACYCDVEYSKRGALGKLREILGETGLNYRQKGVEGGDELINQLLYMDIEVGGASTLLVKREAIERINGFDESFPRHQDWEFLIRILTVGKLAFANEKLVKKHDTGGASFETLLRAKKLYISKFAYLYKKYGLDADILIKEHNRHLAKVAFRNGQYGRGGKYLLNSNIRNIGQVFEILYSISVGIKKWTDI